MIPIRNILTAYRWYNKEYEKKHTISIATYRSIVTGYWKFILKKVFEGYFVQLSGGESLGTIGISGKKQEPKIDEETGKIKGLAPDWGATRKLWDRDVEAFLAKRVVYCFNEHTNGVIYSLVWRKTEMKLPNKMYYSFTFCRTAKRTVSPSVRAGKEYYIKSKILQNEQ